MHHTPIDPHTHARTHDLAKAQARQVRQQAMADFWAAAFAAVQGLVTGKARPARTTLHASTGV